MINSMNMMNDDDEWWIDDVWMNDEWIINK